MIVHAYHPFHRNTCCSTGCPNVSYYGDNCSTPCHQNCLDGRCDVVDGTCVGCVPGYTGSMCDTGCKWYWKEKWFQQTKHSFKKYIILYSKILFICCIILETNLEEVIFNLYFSVNYYNKK